MTPDLRVGKPYPKPLPSVLLYVSVGASLVLLGGIAYLGLEWRKAHAVKQTVAARQTDIVKAKERIRSFDVAVNGLESSRELRASLDQWKNGGRPAAVLQATALVACAETEAYLVELAKKDGDAANNRPRQRGRQTNQIRLAPALVVRSMSVTARPELGAVELTMELGHTTEARTIIPQLNTRLAQINPSGLSLTSFRSEDRGNVLNIVTLWKSTTLASANP